MSMFMIEFVRSTSSCVSQTSANLSDSILLRPLHRSTKSSGAAMLPATAIVRVSLGSARGWLDTGMGNSSTFSCKETAGFCSSLSAYKKVPAALLPTMIQKCGSCELILSGYFQFLGTCTPWYEELLLGRHDLMTDT